MSICTLSHWLQLASFQDFQDCLSRRYLLVRAGVLVEINQLDPFDIGKCLVINDASEPKPPKLQPITGYHTDDKGHWVAQLACGHNQHVRHDPPFERRDWVQTHEGRQSMIGFQLTCKKCVEGAPADEQSQGRGSSVESH